MRERAEYDELVWLLTLKYVGNPEKFREFFPVSLRRLTAYLGLTR